MQRVLVVGGAGVVGSHLVDRLLKAGNEVIAIDDLSRGSFANLAHLKRDKRFVFLEHDVAARFRAQVECVFHLAVPSTKTACEPDPVKAVMTCVDGTMNVLEVAAANGARVVVGDAAERWGEGVRCAESLAIDFARIRGIDVRFVRLPSAYGPRMAPDGEHIVSSMVLQALRGEDLAPRMRLDRRVRLAFVDDIVEALMLTMNSDQRASTVVAPSSEASVLDLAKMIAEAAGLSGLAVTDGSSDAPPSMPTSGRPMLDALSASTAVGLTPSVQLTEGLERTVQWFAARTADRRQGRTSRTSGIYARDPARAPARDTSPDEAPATLRTG